ncbi:laccase-2 [Crucibulum laeve]|uniref:laccase n=1 Tax=Crucibulum laeve TaxID=68775 RepID=A0A5C3LG68_9AGAR|nr:laccase-2 [Crucibulum laeve]
MRFLLPAFIALGLSIGVHAAIGPVATVNIANANIAPDGFTRSAVLAGGTFPGPVISGNKGANFRLNVVNSLTDITMHKTTSIHWHGLFQAGTNWADGPAFVTQCPIASGDSFLYDFDVPDQAGTFWYHSHLSTQYCDGLRGAFVVYDPNDPHKDLYDYDDDAVSPQEGPIPTPDSTLINGLGRYVLGPASPLAVVNVVSSKRYRFRLVSVSCDPNFTFSIDGHTLSVIEVDGVNHHPITVDSIQIFAGQRYSFVLTANQTVSNYWIRANPSIGTQGYLGGLNSAILRYSGAPVANPTTLGGISLNPLRETDLHPLSNTPAPGAPNINGADVDINLAIAFNPLTFDFTVNGVSFVPPTVPVLLQILSGTTSPSALLPAGSVYSLPANKVIQLTIPAGVTSTLVGSPHPFHLHGHTFHVIRSAGSLVYNYVNPVIRDVVSTGVLGDSVTIRFVTDNSGPWLLHCHIDWHFDTGLAVVMAEDIPGTAAANPVPPAWEDLCPIYNALSATDKGAIV